MLSKLTRGNQVTIPKEIVKKAHLHEGKDYVNIDYSNGVITMIPVDVEERIPAENYERLIKKALAKEPGDVMVDSGKAADFLKKRMKK